MRRGRRRNTQLLFNLSASFKVSLFLEVMPVGGWLVLHLPWSSRWSYLITGYETLVSQLKDNKFNEK